MRDYLTVDPSQVDVTLPYESGYPDSLAALDTPEALRDAAGDATREFPAELWIDPKDWPTKAEENNANHTWPMDYIDRFTNQNPTDECTMHSERAGFEACRNRQRGVIYGGPQAGVRLPESALYGSVWVSPLSGYAEANPRKNGGAGTRQVLEIVTRRGFLPETIQPRDYGFKHALHGTTGKGGINQASGPWVALSRFPEGWQETAKHFRVLEVIFPGSWEELVCLVLHGRVVNVGRNGHAVPHACWIPNGPDPNNGKMAYPDSYDVVRYDSARTLRACVGGASAISSVTVPDDWNKPAG